MKKTIVIGFIFQILCIRLYSQTWTVEGDENFDFEYTVITQEQWSRIVRSHETTDESAMLKFVDNIEATNSRVIKGQKPNFKGYYYISAKGIPKNDMAKIALNYITAIVCYGNSETGVMAIQFMGISFLPNSVSLKYEKNDYIQQKNELIKLVNLQNAKAASEQNRLIAEQEFNDLADLASSAGLLSFMDETFNDIIKNALKRCTVLEGVIISGPNGEEGFEKIPGEAIEWVNNAPRFKNNRKFSKQQLYQQLRIKGVRNVTIQGVYRK